MITPPEILRITEAYLAEQLDYAQLMAATQAFKALLHEICGEDLDVATGRDDLVLDNGKALGTYWAAICLDDLLRTRQFVRGINAAMRDKLSVQQNIHVLYAGTGPFATLILPLLFRYAKHEVRYTLLEINPFTFRILQNTLAKLGLEDYDLTLVNADATKWELDPKNLPDIIISETMQNALAKEQQVPIFLNLMRQAKADTVFIPEKITISVGLQKAGDGQNEAINHPVNQVFELSRAAMFPAGQPGAYDNGVVSFPPTQTFIASEKLREYGKLALFTEIQVYGDEHIRINQSGLTTPLTIQYFAKDVSDDFIIDTQYQLAAEPKLEYTLRRVQTP